MHRIDALKSRFQDSISEMFRTTKEHLEKAETRGRAEFEPLQPTVEKLAEVARGTAIGGKEFTQGLAGLLISEERISDLRKDIENQGGSYRELVRGRPKVGNDAFILGGEFWLMNSIGNSFSQEILDAYAKAYPQLAAQASLSETLAHMSPEQVNGVVAAIKGKLFEQRYVDYLNDGHNLPDGYVAALAPHANQAGWDIAVSGPDGHITQLIQAKATESIGYVKEAIQRYPHIDVVTTDEVYSQLSLQGISDHIYGAGITNSDLTHTVAEAISDHLDIVMSCPPLITMAIIAFTSYRAENLDLYEKAQMTTNRAGKSYIGYLLGSGCAAVTNTWWLGLAATVVSRHVADRGLRKWALYDQLKDLKQTNQEVLDRMRRFAGGETVGAT